MAVRKKDWKPKIDDPEVQMYILDEAGEEGLEMANYLAKKSPVSGVDILEDHKELKPSDVRKVLYRLMMAHIAEYEKDTDSTGWETFTWRLDLPEIGLVLQRRWKDELDHLRKQKRFEEDHQFYSCPRAHRRIVFEDAMDLGFRCPVCREGMEPIDNTGVVAALQERIDELAPYLET